MKIIKKGKRGLAFILAVILFISVISPITSVDVRAATEGITLNNPIIVEDSSMNAGQKVTYDCIWFGSYPQTEVICEDAQVQIEALDAANQNGNQIEYDLLPYEEFYAIERGAYDSNGEAIVNGVKYKRIYASSSTNKDCYAENGYPWTSGYHYFRYDKIKWRVLKTDDEKILVLADKVIGSQYYGFYSMNDMTHYQWSVSNARKWLNGYTEYLDDNFIDKAFSINEQRVIQERWVQNLKPSNAKLSSGSNTLDKIFLLSYFDVEGTTETSKDYGFVEGNDEAKKAVGSAYAQALLGTNANTGDKTWLLRTVNYGSTASGGALYVYGINAVGNLKSVCSRNYYGNGIKSIRPAMYLDLSGSALFSYAGTVCTDGTVNEVGGHINSSVENGSSLITGGSSGSESTGSTSNINVNVGTVSEVGTPETESTMSKIENAVAEYLKVVMVDTDLGAGKIKGPSLSVKEDKYTFTPLNFDFKVKLPFNNIKHQIVVDEDSKTVKVLLGVSKKDSANIVRTTDVNGPTWSKQYKEIKQLYKDTSLGKMPSNSWNRFQKLKGNLNSMGCDLFVKANMTLAGYMEFDYHTGELEFKEGGLIEEVSVATNVEFPIYANIVTINLGLEVGEKGTIGIIASEQTVTPAFSLEAYIKASASIAGKIPLELAKVEGGVSATLTGRLSSEEPKVTVDMSGELFLKLTFLKIFDVYSQSWQFMDCQIYPEFVDKMAEETAATYNLRAPIMMLDEATVVTRSYYSEEDSKISLENGGFLNSSVYQYTSARIVDLKEDKKLMVYIDDLGTKTDNNRTSIMYTVFDGANWNEPQELYSDELYYGEFFLSQVDEAGNVYLVFEKGKQEFTDDMTVSEIVQNIDLCMVSFDGSEFSDLIILQSNSAYKSLQSITNNTDNVGISWIEYSEDYLNGNSSEASIVNATYHKSVEEGAESVEITTLESTSNQVYSIVSNNELVYSVEYDEKQDTYLLNKLDELGNITVVAKLSGNIKLYVDKGILYYINEGVLYSYDGETITSVLSDSVSNMDDFVVISDDTQTYVVFKINDGYQSELYKSWDLQDSGATKAIEKITDYGKYIRTFDAVLGENGSVKALINSCDIVSNGNDVNYENSSLLVTKCENVVNDISLDYVCYNCDDIQVSSVLPLDFQVTNNSQSVLDEFTVELIDEEENILTEETYSCDVEQGASAEFSLDYLIPEGIGSHTVVLKLSVNDVEETDLTNNVVSTDIGNADIYIESTQLEAFINGDRTIKTTIINGGFEDAENTHIYCYQNTVEGQKLICEKEVQIVEAGSIQEVDINFNDDELDRMKNDILSLTIKLETDSEEMNLGNNSYDVCYNKSDLNFPMEELEILITETEALLENEQYTTETLTPLLENLINAKKTTVLSDGSEIIKAYENLIDAKSKLVEATAKITLTSNPDNSGILSGGGNYKVGDEITITSKAVKGYTFDGWYLVKDGQQERYTDEVSFTITISEEYDLNENSINFIAKYIPNEISYLSVIVGKGIVEYSVNSGMETGEWENDITKEPFRKGTEIQLAAKDMIGYDFLYWINVDTGKVVSETKEYTIVMGDSLKLQACYISSTNLKHYVVFKDINNSILWSGTVVEGATVDEPNHGNFVGLVFKGWDADFSSITSSIIINAVYDKLGGYNLTVTGGTVVEGKDKYEYGDTVTVVAKESDNGKYFSGWYEDNSLVSTSITYSFYITGDKTLEARYEGDDVVGEQALISMVMSERENLDSGKQTIKMDVVWSVPDEYELLSAGVIMTLSDDNKNMLTLENVDGSSIRKGVSALTTNEGTYSYTLTLGTSAVSKNLYAVGYYQYQDKETGEIIVNYTDVNSSMAN